jgi:Tol biopolymer transport system component
MSPDGKRALFSARGDIFTVPAKEGPTRNLTASSGAHDRNPKWSPDGKWIAYVSDETGQGEVYIRPFREGPAGANDRIQISTGSGDFPGWSRNGNELFFISNDMNLRQVDMRNLGSNRGSGAILFKVCPGTALNTPPGVGAVWAHPYDVASDGRFLFNCMAEPPGRFVVWANWRAASPDAAR